MPTNPNIIMQAGRVTPIRRRDPLREALAIENIKSSRAQSNALAAKNQREASLRNALTAAQGDPQKVRDAYNQAGMPGEAVDFETKALNVGEKRRNNELRKTISGLQQVIQNNGAGFEQWRAMVDPDGTQFVDPATGQPAQYDPAGAQQLLQSMIQRAQTPEGMLKHQQAMERADRPKSAAQMAQARELSVLSRNPPMMVNSGNTTTQHGKLEKGFMRVMRKDKDGNTVIEDVPIKGSKEWFKRREGERAEAVAKENTKRSSDVVIEDIGRLRNLIKMDPNITTGFLGNILKDWAGTSASDASTLIDTISANVGFDRLQQMRNASKTGGALGAINKTEMDLLQAVLGSLKQKQSADQFLYNLDRLERITFETVHGPGTWNRDELGAPLLQGEKPGWSIRRVE